MGILKLGSNFAFYGQNSLEQWFSTFLTPIPAIVHNNIRKPHDFSFIYMYMVTI